MEYQSCRRAVDGVTKYSISELNDTLPLRRPRLWWYGRPPATTCFTTYLYTDLLIHTVRTWVWEKGRESGYTGGALTLTDLLVYPSLPTSGDHLSSEFLSSQRKYYICLRISNKAEVDSLSKLYFLNLSKPKIQLMLRLL